MPVLPHLHPKISYVHALVYASVSAQPASQKNGQSMETLTYHRLEGRWAKQDHWSRPSRGGAGDLVLTQTPLPEPAGRTASLPLSLRAKPSKTIIIPHTPPTALLVLGTMAHKPGGSQSKGVAGGWAEIGPHRNGASGVLLVTELEN